MSKSSKRPMKSWFNAKSAAAYRRQRNREYTTRHEEVMAAKREERKIREMEEEKYCQCCGARMDLEVMDNGKK